MLHGLLLPHFPKTAQSHATVAAALAGARDECYAYAETALKMTPDALLSIASMLEAQGRKILRDGNPPPISSGSPAKGYRGIGEERYWTRLIIKAHT